MSNQDVEIEVECEQCDQLKSLSEFRLPSRVCNNCIDDSDNIDVLLKIYAWLSKLGYIKTKLATTLDDIQGVLNDEEILETCAEEIELSKDEVQRILRDFIK